MDKSFAIELLTSLGLGISAVISNPTQFVFSFNKMFGEGFKLTITDTTSNSFNCKFEYGDNKTTNLSYTLKNSVVKDIC